MKLGSILTSPGASKISQENSYLTPMNELGLAPEEACPYLDGKKAQLQFSLLHQRDDIALDEALARGYRRNGPLLYIPKCPDCRACVPIRVHTQKFKMSKSQSRIWKKTHQKLTAEVGPLRITSRHIQLFNEHALSISPDNHTVDAQGYAEFLASYAQSKQIEFYMEDELVAVGIVDQGASSLSSVYFFWDPQHKGLSLGTYSALWEIAYCVEHSLEFYYLGFWIEGCNSMSYKNRFRPYQLFDFEKQEWSQDISD